MVDRFIILRRWFAPLLVTAIATAAVHFTAGCARPASSGWAQTSPVIKPTAQPPRPIAMIEEVEAGELQ